jgi:hypothetical protein
MAKITKSTDKSGRTVYKIAGTKKYAFTLAKAKEIAAKGSTSTKAPARRTAAARKKPSTGSAKRLDEKYVKVFHANMPDAVGRYTPAGVAATKRLLAAFKKDPHTIAEKYGVGADYVSAGFIKRIEGDLKYLIEDYAHLRKEDRAIAAARKSGRLPALRGSGKTSKPKRRTTKRVTKAYAAPVPKSRRRPAKGGKKVGRQKPAKVLGVTVQQAMTIVRTKGRLLKLTDAKKKAAVAKYRKALQRAGFLR